MALVDRSSYELYELYVSDSNNDFEVESRKYINFMESKICNRIGLQGIGMLATLEDLYSGHVERKINWKGQGPHSGHIVEIYLLLLRWSPLMSVAQLDIQYSGI